MFGKFLIETTQVHAKNILARYIVHTQEVVHSLPGQHLCEEIWLDSEILPPDFPLYILIGARLALILTCLPVVGGCLKLTVLVLFTNPKA